MFNHIESCEIPKSLMKLGWFDAEVTTKSFSGETSLPLREAHCPGHPQGALRMKIIWMRPQPVSCKLFLTIITIIVVTIIVMIRVIIIIITTIIIMMIIIIIIIIIIITIIAIITIRIAIITIVKIMILITNNSTNNSMILTISYDYI